MDSPQHPPLCWATVSPTNPDDHQRLLSALNELALQDSSLRVSTNKESGQTIIQFAGELHLEIIVDRLRSNFKIEASLGKPHVLYRETIRKSSQSEGKFIRQSGHKGQYAHVNIRMEPNPGNGYEFVNEITGGSIPEKYMTPIDAGIRQAMQGGVLAGHEMMDIKITLYDGSYHECDSTEMAFKIAAAMAFKEAAKKASPVLMEPVMSVEIVVPEDFIGVIVGDLNSRRGYIEGMEHRSGSQVIKATVPLSEMFGYATTMRSSTQGRATFAMHFARYEQRPKLPGDGDETAGVVATKPKPPTTGRGAASVNPLD
jgi:elongation factor G